MNAHVILNKEEISRTLDRLASQIFERHGRCDSLQLVGIQRRGVDLARRLDLGLSGGSDYHGRNKPRIRLGHGYGGLRVPLDILEDLKARRRQQGLPC